ncbi:uncharacterized protein K452DRAFT_50064 [Aplosporella prunicola CBS 121167]|uniref:Uncharacterized protein n=1 Tax=Aplosporella prunicola CBS 121167 TaxID=1176127 RepID=A0A6A6BAS2_9PEZI|nr:uncharacterized protein K452DRAFT_50064 [Aplosporella prunicola CBS 121167]KAF2140688.1 hypothetical protein K452DRAFT_50064 [Aplosporella prunicola CBS 121167]
MFAASRRKTFAQCQPEKSGQTSMIREGQRGTRHRPARPGCNLACPHVYIHAVPIPLIHSLNITSMPEARTLNLSFFFFFFFFSSGCRLSYTNLQKKKKSPNTFEPSFAWMNTH